MIQDQKQSLSSFDANDEKYSENSNSSTYRNKVIDEFNKKKPRKSKSIKKRDSEILRDTFLNSVTLDYDSDNIVDQGWISTLDDSVESDPEVKVGDQLVRLTSFLPTFPKKFMRNQKHLNSGSLNNAIIE